MFIKKCQLCLLNAILLLSPALRAADLTDEELKKLGPVRQNNFTNCVPDFSPGEKFLTSKRQWQGCPTILRTRKGTLYAGWYAGGPGEGLLNYSLLSKSTDNGVSWTKEPLLVVDSLTEKKIQSLDVQFWLDPDGKFWYFWTQRDYNYPAKNPRHFSVWAMTCDDPDAETLKWSKPFFVSPGFLRCQPTVLRDGRWLLCAYDWSDDYYRYSESSDKGKTWFRRRAGKKHSQMVYDETMILEEKNGTLRMLARCPKKVGFLAECFSHDGGKTWSDAKLSKIPNPGSRFFIKRLRSGKILMVNNWEGGNRYNLTAALSTDDGKTWKYKLLLDPRRCTYPDAVEGEDGEIFIVYDCLRRSLNEILICRLTERDIMEGLKRGALRVPSSYMRNLISKPPYPARLTPAEKALHDRYRNKSHRRTRFNIEFTGQPKKNFKNIVHGSDTTFTAIKKNKGISFSGEKDLTSQWQSFSFSFVTNTSELTLSLGSQGQVEFDDVKVENASLANPSFEEKTANGELANWNYFIKNAFAHSTDAADGKHFVRTYDYAPITQKIRVQPGKTVKFSFKARASKTIISLPYVPWCSGQNNK